MAPVSAEVAPFDAPGAASVLASRPSLMSPAQCAEHIASMHALGALINGAIHAQTLECCWRIWRECDAAEAERLIRERTPLPVPLSRRYADVWEAARGAGNRALFDTAASRPTEALRLVEDVAEAMDAGEIGEDVGREAARIVALPRRRRAEALQELIEARDAAAAGRSPADVQRIADLEDDVAALRAEREASSPAARWADIHRRLGAVVTEAEDLAREAARAPRSKRHDERAMRACDSLWAATDALLEAVRPKEDE